MHRAANQNVVQKAFELNAASNAIFGALRQLIPELEMFMQQLEQASNTMDLSADQANKVRQLQDGFQSLRSNHLNAVKSEQERFAEVAMTIIHSLLRSGKHLDHMFKANHIARSVTRSPEPTLRSAPAEVDIGGQTVARSKSVIQYLSRLGDIDLIQEKLTDLYIEREQLQDEQESRRRFGLTLNDEALELLESFKKQEIFLEDELEFAQTVMEALRELVHDAEALKISNEAYEENIEEEPRQLEFLDPAHQKGLSLPQFSFQPPRPSESDSDLDQPPDLDLQLNEVRFADFYNHPDLTAQGAATARFIDTWMLHRIHLQPELLARFTTMLPHQHEGEQAENLRQRFLDLWFDESFSAQFDQIRTDADKRSMQVSQAHSWDSKPADISSMSQLSVPMPLLRTGPETTANELIEHAIQTRSLTSSPSLTARQ
jgi:hypothetical protein